MAITFAMVHLHYIILFHKAFVIKFIVYIVRLNMAKYNHISLQIIHHGLEWSKNTFETGGVLIFYNSKLGMIDILSSSKHTREKKNQRKSYANIKHFVQASWALNQDWNTVA